MNKEHLHPDGRPYTKEEFVEKIKTDKEFAKKFGNLGKIYGSQWRNWNGNIDQISDLIKQLKENPDSRRLLVSAWNPADLPHQVLPPCHYGFQVYTRELSHDERFEIYKNSNIGGRVLQNHIIPINFKQFHFDEANIPTRAIYLMWNQRSVDTFLGLPFNIASYGLLLEIIAKEVNMVPDELIGNLGDTHLYANHVDQAQEQIGRELTTAERNEWFQINLNGNNPRMKSDWKDFELDQQNVPTRTREPFPLPKLLCLDEFHYLMDKELVGEIPFTEKIEKFRPDFFTLENYQSHPTIKAPLSN